jgi:NitT/TauT family transport system permease protein
MPGGQVVAVPASGAAERPAAATGAWRRLLRKRPELVLSPALLVVLLVAWEYAIPVFKISPFILPPPSQIWASLVDGIGSGLYLRHLAVTMAQAVCGFLVASTLGLVIGAVIARSRLFERVVYPYLVALQTVPKIAIAPLIIIWFGYGMSSKIVVSALLAFFPVLVNAIVGLKSCDQGRLDVMRALAASEWQIFWMLRLPNALPFIFAGLNVAVIFSVLGAIVGEFVGSQAGLGHLIIQANAMLDVPRVFSILVVLSVMGISLFLLLQWLRKRIVFWSNPDQLAGV